MSNYLAIATVSAALQHLLQAALNVDVPGATATTARPDGQDNGLPASGVNIYLYQVAPNAAWRNADLPTRTPSGGLMQRPRVALDLHYLLTFYGDEGALQPQRILGSVARALHAQPVLTRERIEATRQAALATDPDHFLGDSDLAAEVELVKFMPLTLTLEELSRLWSVFFQTAYTLSMAYLATTVLIEADAAPQRALPVRVRNVSAVTFRQAVIEAVVSADGDDAPVVVGDEVLLKGRRLFGEIAGVRLGVGMGLQPAPLLSPSDAGDRAIRVTLSHPDLQAGVQGVQVVYATGAESNVAPLVLRPQIVQDGGGNYEIDVTDVVVDPEDGSIAATVAVHLAPAVGVRQQVLLYLNQQPPAADPRAYVFPAAARTAVTDTIEFEIKGVQAGAYLLRVQVAGAESLLEVDGAGRYSAPAITL